MTTTVPRFEELIAPSHWRTVDFISDLHLQASEPATVAAFRHYLQTTPVDALFILGDLFEVWVGDDAMDEPGSFEAEGCAALSAASQRLPLYFMHGNRDFLAGPAFLQRTDMAGLADPTVLVFGEQRIVLSHGDLLCLADVDYQRFRVQARSSARQQAFLAQPWPRAAPRRAASARRARPRSSRAPPMPIWTALPPSPGCRRQAPAPWSTATPTARPCTPSRPGSRGWF